MFAKTCLPWGHCGARMAAMTVACVGLWVATSAAAGPAGPAPRKWEEVRLDLTDLDVQLRKIAPSGYPGVFAADPQARAANMQAAIPLFKKHLALLDEVARMPVPPIGRYGAAGELFITSLLVACGDEPTTKKIHDRAKGAGDAAFYAKTALAVANIYLATGNSKAQVKGIGDLRTLLKETKGKEKDDTFALTTVIMLGNMPDPAANAALEKLIADDLTAPEAKRFINSGRADRPIVLTSTDLAGRSFSTEKLKGKVVVLHLWSPSNDEGRRTMWMLKDLLGKYKKDGLEIVGVASARSRDELVSYLKDKGFDWPQVFDPKSPSPHPFVTQTSLSGPNMLVLIDREGILRWRDLPVAKAEGEIKTWLAKPPASRPAKAPAGD